MDIVETYITEEELVHITAHKHLYINPYNGCTEDCPYCYWKDMPGWDGRLEIRMNAEELFETFLKNTERDTEIYIGSVCNPYDTVEETYGLTRKLLEVLVRYHRKFAIMTSSHLILRDLDLLEKLKDLAVIVFELSRIERMKSFQRTGKHPVIEAANQMAGQGFHVLSTLSPYLEGITDLEKILETLTEEIPVYTAELDIRKGTAMEERFLNKIGKEYPSLMPYYKDLIEQDRVGGEFERRMRPYIENGRVRRFPLDVSGMRE